MKALPATCLIWMYGALSATPSWSEPQPTEALNVSIAAPAFWCPYACDKNEPRWGAAVEIVRAALASGGHNVTYQNSPYERALFEVRIGRIDATVPTFKGEASDFIFPKHAVSSTEYCFYVSRDETWRYSDHESLGNIHFVATSGYTYGQVLDAYISENLEQSVTLLRGENIPDRMRRMVRMKRVDALLDDRLLFEFDKNNKGLINAGCLPERHPGYLALSPKTPDRSKAIAEAFDRGFERIQANGQLCQILEKYGLSARFVPHLDAKHCSR
ncbi:type 2 periplasmic-binding domain-containing protein [Marinobacter salsuginis]|uniref:transporter substrate-binding domain-containing protein n=1 Tax=Marinobacter salsuginis TaxID=418719 RepID=UPI001AE0ADCD|nr:transporter substrate-binding domain-containing protein [Marinobacter salsuginis]QTN40532.1 transporter substrate-binding domain-containing protein [Marinobacter salsuginis]